MRAIKGWIWIHHRFSSVVLHLSVWFGQTTPQEYTNFRVLLDEVDKPLRASMNERMGCFTVVSTGPEAPPLARKFSFAFFVRFCFENLLEFIRTPSMTRCDKNVQVRKEVQRSFWGKVFSPSSRLLRNSISFLTSAPIFHRFSARWAVTANGPSHKGRSLSSPSRVVLDFRAKLESPLQNCAGFFGPDSGCGASQPDAFQ